MTYEQKAQMLAEFIQEFHELNMCSPQAYITTLEIMHKTIVEQIAMDNEEGRD